MRSAWLLVASASPRTGNATNAAYVFASAWRNGSYRRRTACAVYSPKHPSELEGLSLREVTEWIPTAFFRLQGQGFLQDLGRFPSKAQRPAGFAFLHLFQIVQQVADTFLFQPGPKSLFVVSQIAIRRQDAFELSAQDIDHHVAAAIVPNGVDADFPIGEDPEPSRQGANSPTGLIRVHHTAQPNELDQLFIHRSGGLGQLLICLTPPAAAHRQSEGVV